MRQNSDGSLKRRGNETKLKIKKESMNTDEFIVNDNDGDGDGDGDKLMNNNNNNNNKNQKQEADDSDEILSDID